MSDSFLRLIFTTQIRLPLDGFSQALCKGKMMNH